MKLLVLFFLIGLLVSNSSAGPITGSLCSACCAGGVVTCYAAAGFTFGTVTAGASTPAVIVGCNLAFGVCMAKCAALTGAPIP